MEQKIYCVRREISLLHEAIGNDTHSRNTMRTLSSLVFTVALFVLSGFVSLVKTTSMNLQLDSRTSDEKPPAEKRNCVLPDH